MNGWPLAAGAVATTLRFLACLSAVNEPDFWNFDPELPGHYLPILLDREKLFKEVGELLEEGRQWPVVNDRDGIVIRSTWSPRYQRPLFYGEADMPASPMQMLDVFWANGMKIPDWNPTADKVEIVKDFDDTTRITWQSTKAQLGGIISKRDFVNVNYWRKVPPLDSPPSSSSSTSPSAPQDGDTGDDFAVEIAYTNATWPDRPPTGGFVRGQNGPSVMVFSPIPGPRPGQVHSRLRWVFNAHMDFSAIIPTAIITRILPSNLNEYLGQLRRHVAGIHPA